MNEADEFPFNFDMHHEQQATRRIEADDRAACSIVASCFD